MEVTMKVLEALAAAIAAEGIDHIFAVMGDANQTSLWSCVKNTGSNTFTRIMRLPPLAWRTAIRASPERSALPAPRKAPAFSGIDVEVHNWTKINVEADFRQFLCQHVILKPSVFLGSPPDLLCGLDRPKSACSP
jgi:hypothetical protein